MAVVDFSRTQGAAGLRDGLRLMALDLGSKTIGVAASDGAVAGGLLGLPLITLEAHHVGGRPRRARLTGARKHEVTRRWRSACRSTWTRHRRPALPVGATVAAPTSAPEPLNAALRGTPHRLPGRNGSALPPCRGGMIDDYDMTRAKRAERVDAGLRLRGSWKARSRARAELRLGIGCYPVERAGSVG